VSLLTDLAQLSKLTPRQLQAVLGSCQVAAELIPLGLLHLRYSGLFIFSPGHQQWTGICRSRFIPPFHAALMPWTDKVWLTLGVTLQPVLLVYTLCTDASSLGLGAY
jgi:hypothetical protein